MPAWIIWTLLTLISWGVWAILFRLMGDSLSSAQSQAVSTLGVIPILAALCLMKDVPHPGNRPRGVLLALGSGILSCLGNVACYEALNHAKAATVVPLTALYPLVTVLLAVPLLKERVNLWQLIGIGASLAAIYLFNVPQAPGMEAGLASRWLLLPVAAILFWGITQLMQKVATSEISPRSTAIWFLVAFVPVAGVVLIQDPLPSDLSPQTWALAAAMGLALALGNLTILLAFGAGGKASIIGPLTGLYPLVSLPISIFGFHEQLSQREAFGIGLALLAVVLLAAQSDPDSASPPIIESTGAP
jgi:transporter family protein